MACKIIGSQRRARREASVLSALDHPNIVRFFGEARPAHLLMEYLDGPTLGRLIRTSRQRRLSVANALRVAIHVGAALTHVHERGFVHLDVKPSNVIVVGGRPVLVDFSTARPRTNRPVGYAAGTDLYIAPAVPVALEKLVLACLAPNPAARPSMAELLPKLHEFIRTGPRMWPETVERARRRSRPVGRTATHGMRRAA